MVAVSVFLGVQRYGIFKALSGLDPDAAVLWEIMVLLVDKYF